MPRAQDILDALACGKAGCPCRTAVQKGYGKTHCPCHDDAHPSLSVKESDGAILLYCHARCPQNIVIDALRSRRLWGDGNAPLGQAGSGNSDAGETSQHSARSRFTRYEVRDAAGNRLAIHVREDRADATKRMWWERPDGTPGLNGMHTADLPLYGTQLLRERPNEPVILTEGEKAADALLRSGHLAVGTVTGAGGTPATEALRALVGREVFLWPDADPPGHDHMDRIAQRLVDLGVTPWMVEWDKAPAGGDAADYVETHGSRALLAQASSWVPTEAATTSPQGDETEPAIEGLLESATALLQRYVAFPSPHHVTACTLWAAHTWVYDRFDVSPFLHVGSPERRSGKTRLLEIMELLVRAPWRIISPSEAVLFRKIDREHPTTLLDEVDTIFGRGRDNGHEPLRALLNAGNRRGVTVPRCVGEGARMQVVEFNVFTPRVLAGIGDLPDTVADRSIPIRLQRRARHEHLERFRVRDAAGEARPIQDGLERWAVRAGDDLARARPEVPEALNDRAGEIWEPLLAIADLAGGDWPQRAREAAVALHGDSTVAEETAGVLLLRAIRDAFDERETDRISTEDLVEDLGARDDILLPEWWHRARKEGDLRGIGRWLSRRLRHFEVTVTKIRTDKGPVQGYLRADFENTFARYAPRQNGGATRNNGTTTENQGSARDSVSEHPDGTDPQTERRQPLQNMACSVVPSSGAREVGAKIPEASSNCPPRPPAGSPEGAPVLATQSRESRETSIDGDDGRGQFILDMGQSLGFPRLDIGHGEAITTGAAAWGLFVTKATPEQIRRAAATLAQDSASNRDGDGPEA